jgi:hypothetical protein
MLKYEKEGESMLSGYIRNYIENFLRKELMDINFDEICYSDYDSNCCADYLKESLPHCLSVRCGASKVVLFYTELTKLGYCVKIPFLGVEEYDEDTGEFYHSSYEYANSIFGSWTEYRAQTSTWDYCNVESFICERAKDENLDKFFACTFYLCDINHHPIYLAEIADSTMSIPCENCKSPTWSESYQKGLNFENYFVSDEAMGFFIDNYGESECHRFLNFLDRFNVGDLSESNIGFKDGKIKLIDYSDFND